MQHVTNRAVEKAGSRSFVGGPFVYFLKLDQLRNIADGPCGHDAKSGRDHAMEGKAPHRQNMTMPQTQAATYAPSAKVENLADQHADEDAGAYCMKYS
jgi:hypothetical protein